MYYNNENVTWFNQTLFSIQDEVYKSDGHLRLSISNNTKDFFSFSTLFLNLSISNNHSKSILINIQNATDLTNSIRSVINSGISKIYDSNLDSNHQFQIFKKYNKNVELIFEFVLDKYSNEKLVRITIRSNESDFTKVLINFNVFIVLSFRIKWFVENYENATLSFNNLFLQRNILDSNKQILNAIKSLPSSIGNIKDIDENNNNLSEEIEQETFPENNSQINEFDDFISENIDNIKIPEIESSEKPKESIQKFDDSVILKQFKNLNSFEKMLINSESTNNPFSFILDKFKATNTSADFSFDLKEEDYKSLIYISKLFCSSTIKNVIEYNGSIPSTIRILKYNIQKDINKDSVSFALDLLSILSYLHIMKKNLETKIDDPTTNKSLVYLIFRSYLDPLIFSILEKVDKNTIKSSVISRFKYFKSINFFNNHDLLLESYSCNLVKENNVSAFIDNILQVFGNAPFINDLHDQMYNSGHIKLPSKHDLTEEQITKEVIPLEIYANINKDITKFSSFDNLSEDVKNIFKKYKKSKTTKNNSSESGQNNLFRLIKQYRNQIPETIRENFLSYVEKFKGDFDPLLCTYSLETLGDDIIKILYLWKPSEDEKLEKNFKYFFEKFENEIMTKDLILAKFNSTEISDNSNEAGWNMAFE